MYNGIWKNRGGYTTRNDLSVPVISDNPHKMYGSITEQETINRTIYSTILQ